MMGGEAKGRKTMKAYKGFNKDMTCRDFQYVEGGEYDTASAEVCRSGFHACENPLDCFAYYHPSKGSIFHEVELGGDIQRCDVDTKCAATKIKIGARLTLAGMIKAGLDFVLAKVKKSKTPAATSGVRSTAATSGDYSTAATSGFRSTAATSGDYSTAATSGVRSTAATSGDRSTAATSGFRSTAEVHSKESVAVVTGLDSMARGCVGSWLVLTERDDNWHIFGIKAICIDGKKYNADTWYTLKGGLVVRAEP